LRGASKWFKIEAMKHKNRQNRLGLERLQSLTPKAARQRVRFLEQRLERGAYKGETAKIAKRWASWYRSFAKAA